MEFKQINGRKEVYNSEFIAPFIILKCIIKYSMHKSKLNLQKSE